MQHVTIYTKPLCPYCWRAKALLKKKGAEFEEIDVLMDTEALQTMLERSGGRHTVPQIFVGDTHVGGSDELAELEHDGRLDELLSGVG